MIHFWLCCPPFDPLPVGETAELTIGRHESNDLVLPHSEVSRFHAIFKVSSHGVIIQDLGSSNGIVCNGVPHAEIQVAIGDEIQIGPYELHLQASPREAAETRCAAVMFGVDLSHAFSGNLEETPLIEVLQGLEFNQKSGCLQIQGKTDSGEITVHKGLPHSASVRDLFGEAAILTLLSFPSGRYSFTNETPIGPGQMDATITGLLFDHSRRVDEAGVEPHGAP